MDARTLPPGQEFNANKTEIAGPTARASARQVKKFSAPVVQDFDQVVHVVAFQGGLFLADFFFA